MGHSYPDLETNEHERRNPIELFHEFMDAYPTELADRLAWLEEHLELRFDRARLLGLSPQRLRPNGSGVARDRASRRGVPRWDDQLTAKEYDGRRVEQCLRRYLSLFAYSVPQAREYLTRDRSTLKGELQTLVSPGVDVESEAALMTLIVTADDNLFLSAIAHFLNKIEPDGERGPRTTSGSIEYEHD